MADLTFESIWNAATRDLSKLSMRDALGLVNAKEEREKEELEQLRKKKQDEENKIKATMGSLIDSYNTSKSVAMKEQIRSSMKSFVGSVDPYLRPALDPYINHSPISEEAEKERRFLEMFPEPPSPDRWGEINGQAVEEGIPKSESGVFDNPLRYAKDYFNYEDWKRKRAAVVLGLDPGAPNLSSRFPRVEEQSSANKMGA